MLRTAISRMTGSLLGIGILFVLILYPLLTLLVQMVFPNLFAVNMSLQPALGPLFSAMTDKLNLEALVNSVVIGLLGAVLASILGVVTAFASTRSSRYGRVAIDLAVWVVMFAPSYVIAQGWVVLMQDGGVFAQVLHLQNGWSAWFFTRFGLTLVMGFKYFPFVHLAMVQAISNLGGEFVQAARMSGASPRQAFFRVVLPLLTPGLLAGMSIAFAEGFGDFGFAAAITPETHIPLVTYQIYQALAQAPVDYSTAAYMSLLLILVTGGALWLQFWWTGRRSYVTVSAQSRVTSQRRSAVAGTVVGAGALARVQGFVRTRAAKAAVLVILSIGFVLPVGGSVLVSVWRVWTNGIAKGNWTLEHYRHVLHFSSSSMQALWASLMYGLIAALCTSALALFLGYQLTFKHSKITKVINTITMASLAIPGVVLAAGFIFAWNATWMQALHLVLYGTAACLAMAYIAIALPYAIRLQYGALSQLSPNLMKAAQVLGAREWKVLVRIVFPFVSPTVVATFFMTFTHTVFELPASMMLYPAGMPTFAVKAEEQFSSFNWSTGSALTLVGVVVVFAGYGLGRVLTRPLEQRFRQSGAPTKVEAVAADHEPGVAVYTS